MAATLTPPTQTFSIREAAGLLSVSAHTLRYYERAGLLDAVPRAGSSHRLYTEREIEALRFVLRLRATGMPITAIRQYMALVRQGEGTQATRQALLEAHKARVQADIARLTQDLGAIQKKLDFYSGQTPASGKAGKA